MKLSHWIPVAAAILSILLLFFALFSYAQAPVGTTLYIKSATFSLKKKTVSATGVVSWPIISRHSTAESAQRAAMKLPIGSYQIDPPTYYLEVRPCDFQKFNYCTDFVDQRISVVQIMTTNRILFVTPLPPGTPIP